MSSNGHPPRRVAFYSHDTQGLGHIRRNITLAGAMTLADPELDVLLLTGNPEATTLPLPPRTDIITLPTVGKSSDGSYSSRTLSSPLSRVTATRAAVLDGALRAFEPGLLVVDKVATGFADELLPALRRLRRTGDTRVVLGLRDILDARSVVEKEWAKGHTAAIIDELYDEVWIYGDPAVADLTRVHRAIGPVADRVRFTGYLAEGRTAGLRPRVRTADRVRPPAEPYVLCLLGGGQDGMELADTFARTAMPAGHRGVLVTGPFLPGRHRDTLRELAAARDDLDLLEYIPDTDEFIAGAAAVVSMAGYNTVCELLAAGRPTLLVPRVIPRLEQRIRARRLAELGVVETLDPQEVSVERLARRLAGMVDGSRALTASPVDLTGLDRVPGFAGRLLQEVDRVA